MPRQGRDASLFEGHSLSAHRGWGRIGPGALSQRSDVGSAGVEEAALEVLVDVVLADTALRADLLPINRDIFR